MVKFKKKSCFYFFLSYCPLKIWLLKTCNQDILITIIAWSFKVSADKMMSSIARSFKLKMTLDLKKGTILMDKQIVGGTVSHKHNF